MKSQCLICKKLAHNYSLDPNITVNTVNFTEEDLDSLETLCDKHKPGVERWITIRKKYQGHSEEFIEDRLREFIPPPDDYEKYFTKN